MRIGPIEQGAVLGDDLIEEIKTGKCLLQVLQLTARHHEKPPPGVAQPLQRRQRWRVYLAVMGQGSVVVGGEREVTHPFILSDLPLADYIRPAFTRQKNKNESVDIMRAMIP